MPLRTALRLVARDVYAHAPERQGKHLLRGGEGQGGHGDGGGTFRALFESIERQQKAEGRI
ncbi:hypothetical protein [Corallococcus sp. CA053C]|uniref:hypothetical protein n=1 Tax=Corallococcus sp. CA053C TaxID=2316732 RepID=UPI0011C47F14|nr:hypothetical protein [Corallococcus sp. CA053C]